MKIFIFIVLLLLCIPFLPWFITWADQRWSAWEQATEQQQRRDQAENERARKQETKQAEAEQARQREQRQIEAKALEAEDDRLAAIPFNIDSLYNEYAANEVAADRAYTGRYFSVQGIITDITDDTDIWSGAPTPCLTIKSPASRGEIGGAFCFFEANERGRMAALSKGDNVIVRGTCDGKFAFYVKFRGCRILAINGVRINRVQRQGSNQ